MYTFKKVLKGSLILSIVTIIQSFINILNQIFFIEKFGSSIETDAYYTAITTPNLINTIVFSGATLTITYKGFNEKIDNRNNVTTLIFKLAIIGSIFQILWFHIQYPELTSVNKFILSIMPWINLVPLSVISNVVAEKQFNHNFIKSSLLLLFPSIILLISYCINLVSSVIWIIVILTISNTILFIYLFWNKKLNIKSIKREREGLQNPYDILKITLCIFPYIIFPFILLLFSVKLKEGELTIFNYCLFLTSFLSIIVGNSYAIVNNRYLVEEELKKGTYLKSFEWKSIRLLIGIVNIVYLIFIIIKTPVLSILFGAIDKSNILHDVNKYLLYFVGTSYMISLLNYLRLIILKKGNLNRLALISAASIFLMLSLSYFIPLPEAYFISILILLLLAFNEIFKVRKIESFIVLKTMITSIFIVAICFQFFKINHVGLFILSGLLLIKEGVEFLKYKKWN